MWEIRCIVAIMCRHLCGCSSEGRATASQAVGSGFDPRHPLILYEGGFIRGKDDELGWIG